MRPGDVISERFVVEELAGRGGMGAVYRASDRATGGRVALKVLHGHGADHAARFAREASLLASLQHPGIVAFVTNGVTPSGDGYLAMEWLEGESLASRLDRGFTVREATTLLLGIAEAVAVAHQRGIVHRDLKPANVFLVGGSVDRVKVLDFGIARVLDGGEKLTLTGQMLGTPGYMAPEQARGDASVDARADVFSLGCLFFRCLTGRAVFQGDDGLAVLLKALMEPAPRVAELRPDVPFELDELCDRALAKVPGERPADAGALARELSALSQRPLTRVAGSRPAGPSRLQMPVVASRGCLVLARTRRAAGRTIVAMPLAARQEREVQLRRALAPFGGALEVMADGSYVVAFPLAGEGAAVVVAAARAALAMRPFVPEMDLAVVEQGPGALDRGVQLLAAPAGSGVPIDTHAAGLLPSGFRVATGSVCSYLVGEAGDAPTVATFAPAGPTPPTFAPVPPPGPAPAAPFPFPSVAPPMAPAKSTTSPWLAAAIGGFVVLAIGAVVFFALQLGGNERASAAPKSKSPSSGILGGGLPPICGTLACEKVPNNRDPIELLPMARTLVAREHPNARLMSLQAKTSGAVIDFGNPECALIINFVDGISIITVVGAMNVLMMNEPAAGGSTPPISVEPCPFRAAVRAARASGVPENGLLSVNLMEPVAGHPAWSFGRAGGSDGAHVDARTCQVTPW